MKNLIKDWKKISKCFTTTSTTVNKAVMVLLCNNFKSLKLRNIDTYC